MSHAVCGAVFYAPVTGLTLSEQIDVLPVISIEPMLDIKSFQSGETPHPLYVAKVVFSILTQSALCR